MYLEQLLENAVFQGIFKGKLEATERCLYIRTKRSFKLQKFIQNAHNCLFFTLRVSQGCILSYFVSFLSHLKSLKSSSKIKKIDPDPRFQQPKSGNNDQSAKCINMKSIGLKLMKLEQNQLVRFFAPHCSFVEAFHKPSTPY